MTFAPALLAEIRSRFAHVDSCPYSGERIFFENAGGALTLNSVVETSARLAAIPDNQGRDNPASREMMRLIAKGRQDMALFMNAPGGQIIIGETGTEMLFRMIRTACMAAPKGARVLGSTLEHPASRSAAAHCAANMGLRHVVVPHNDETGTVTVDDYLPEITADTAVATIVHCSPVSGMSVDVAAIAAAIRERAPDCLIIIDGIQHAAHGAIDLTAYGADGYAVSPYKMFSRHGFGAAWVSDRLTAQPHDNLIGGPGSAWELGTRDAGSYATLSDVVAYLDWLGGQVSAEVDPRKRLVAVGRAIHAHEQALTDAMLHGTGNLRGLAELPGVGIVGGADNPLREGLVSCWVEGIASADLVDALADQGIRVHIRKNDHYCGNVLGPLGRQDCIRVSLCHYNSIDEVARFLSAMAGITEKAAA